MNNPAFLLFFLSIILVLAQAGVRQEKSDDPHRPIYHFLPPAHWMNDPNGLIQWGDTYHMFYQYNPAFPKAGKVCWGHAISKDLIHWKDYPIALEPTPAGPDKDGCWTGCAVDDNGTPTLIYTGVFPECVCIAIGDKELLKWEKYEKNPVIPAPPEGFEVTGFRDPYVWREKDGWYLVLGSGVKGKGGIAFLYKSQDLRTWEYLHPLCEGKEEETGFMWECPNFFPLDGKHILITSPIPLGYPIYLIGNYRNHRLNVEKIGKVDVCPHSFYAPQIFKDKKGRMLMFGWLREMRSFEAQKEAGWSGVMSLPRVLSLTDGELAQDVVPEIQNIRTSNHYKISNVEIEETDFKVLHGVNGDALEIEAVFRPQEAKSFGIVIRRSPNGEERTLIGYDTTKQEVFLDATSSSLDETVQKPFFSAKMVLNDSPLYIRVFIDRSVVEVFFNKKIALTTRIYPTRRDSTEVGLFSKGGKAELERFEAWTMKSIW
ncbi:glycoside hydrolase family 32 protein [bacterium]|nr:glycoside hydrolase family 32 protein [bacterium]